MEKKKEKMLTLPWAENYRKLFRLEWEVFNKDTPEKFVRLRCYELEKLHIFFTPISPKKRETPFDQLEAQIKILESFALAGLVEKFGLCIIKNKFSDECEEWLKELPNAGQYHFELDMICVGVTNLWIYDKLVEVRPKLIHNYHQEFATLVATKISALNFYTDPLLLLRIALYFAGNSRYKLKSKKEEIITYADFKYISDTEEILRDLVEYYIDMPRVDSTICDSKMDLLNVCAYNLADIMGYQWLPLLREIEDGLEWKIIDKKSFLKR